jgi:N-acetyl-gamma-glutamyl-phosphate reductase
MPEATHKRENAPLTAAVVGGAGHAGGELCRLLLGHPHVNRILPTARGEQDFERVHRNLAGSGLEFRELDALLEDAEELDVAFLCTPSGHAMKLAPLLLERGVRVIDVSADFRFADPDLYERVYGEAHASPELLAQAVCGITELHRERIRDARLVANPGCYVIAATLALAPLLRSTWVDAGAPVHVSAVNGTTGAGNSPRKEIMHAQAFASMLPYSMEGHRHGPELEQRLSELAGERVAVTLSTAHGNFARGIYLHATVTIDPERRTGLDRAALLSSYLERYGKGHAGEHFVIVNDLERRGELNAKEYDIYPLMGSVIGSNFCQLGVDYDERAGVVKAMAAIDNLVKGAAGSAIQNMNVMHDLDETAGLRHYGL